MSPFLATLAVMIVLQGARFAYTKGSNSGALPPGFRELGTGMLFGLPINFVALVVLALALGVLLHLSALDAASTFVGGNPRAAMLCGVDADRVTIACYMICGAMASIGGLFLVGYVGLVDNWTGRGYELDLIVAAVMGVALTGGAARFRRAARGTDPRCAVQPGHPARHAGRAAAHHQGRRHHRRGGLLRHPHGPAELKEWQPFQNEHLRSSRDRQVMRHWRMIYEIETISAAKP